MFKRLLRWARTVKAGSDTGQFAVQQVEYNGKLMNVLMVFPYGHHGNVPADALNLLMGIDCNTDEHAAIGWTPKIRPQLKDGEVTFYHPPTGGTATWKQNGDLDITTEYDINIVCKNLNITCENMTVNASSEVIINVPEFTLNGNYTSIGTMTNNGKDVGDTHRHSQGSDSDGDAEQDIIGVL